LPSGYTNVRNAGSETEWIAPVYLGEQLFARSCIVDIIAREGRAGLGIYITQEEQILNSDEQIVLRRRHTLAVFPDKTYPEPAEEHK
jgi:acyl dehydratase